MATFLWYSAVQTSKRGLKLRLKEKPGCAGPTATPKSVAAGPQPSTPCRSDTVKLPRTGNTEVQATH